MMENIEQNMSNENEAILTESFNNARNEFFYDTKEDEFIDTSSAISNVNMDNYSQEEVENLSEPDFIGSIQSKVEDSINEFDGEYDNQVELDVVGANEVDMENVQSQELPTFSNNLFSNLSFADEEADVNEEVSVSNEIEFPKLEENNVEESQNEELELPVLQTEQVSISDSSTSKLDDSYVLSNFDVLFDSLYSDVAGDHNFISNLIEQKKLANVNEANLAELTSKLEREKEEFNKYVEAQKEAIENEKQQCNDYIKTQKQRLQNEEAQFVSDCESTRAELNLAEQTLKVANEKLEDERDQFEKNKMLEEEKLKADRHKFELEKEQFEKEKAIALEKIKNAQKELQLQKEQFAKTKELEEKKLELESKNLSQSCARFKELVTQFNSGFQQLPNNKE